jgi:hypothetical protein
MEKNANILYVLELKKTKKSIRNMVLAIVASILFVSIYKKIAIFAFSKLNQVSLVVSSQN